MLFRSNLLILIARIAKCGAVRYTPAGIPVLDVQLEHESQQQENKRSCLIRFEIAGKIIGEEALKWQNRQGSVVRVSGFLAAQSRRYPKPILRIQDIQEYKG